MAEFQFNTTKYFTDEFKLQSVFPEEVLLLIFNNIKHSSDYHRIDAASPYFHKLLLPLRTRILFPEVIKLCTISKEWTKESHLLLLSLRAVCKSWKQGVEDLFHSILNETNTDPTNWKFFGRAPSVLNTNQGLIMCDRDFNSERKLEKFLEFFDNPHFLTGRYPFPSKSIHRAIFAVSERPLPIYNQLFDVLKICGHHIWHCTVTLWCMERDEMEQIVQLLRSLLELLPQLQTLRIQCSWSYVNCWDNTECLQNNLLAHPLPKLNKLWLLDARGLAPPIFSNLIQNNTHITRLILYELDSAKHSALFTTPLPNLEEFHCVSLRSAEDFTKLKNMESQWPLKKLTIGSHPGIKHVNTLFNLVETKWAETLTDLSIILTSKVSFLNARPLKLPHLQNLKIRLRHYVGMDFILPLSKSLVSLSVHYNGRDEYDNSLETNNTVKFFVHRKNLLKSNIWKYFPRLRELNYADHDVPEFSQGRTYRRNHWDAYNFEESTT